MQVRFWVGNTLQRHFNRRGGAVKDVQACLSVRKDRENSFHNCEAPVKLVQARVWAANTLKRRFDSRAGVLKHVQVCLCPNTHRESNYHHWGGPVKLVQACLCAENTLQLRSRCCEAPADLFKCQ